MINSELDNSPDLASLKLDRRALLGAAGVAALFGLSACGTLPTGRGAGASASATDILAGIRTANGFAPLSPDARLERAALQQAGYMARARRMAHTTGSGKDFAARVKDNGDAGGRGRKYRRGPHGPAEDCSTCG